MYDAILYPTDGSSGSEAALEHVSELASRFDATVHVFYAVEDRAAGLEGPVGGDRDDSNPGLGGNQPEGESPGLEGSQGSSEDREEFEERAEAFVVETAERLADVETEAVVRHGSPHEAILDYVGNHDIDIVVMGTHGRSGVERHVVGSVAENVVRLSDVPVVTVREREERERSS
ncbi:universal stress protein [Natronorarus salvus]|uniref:universal stress protein n=1 Tax=Natronorarus salvus TaxID=3117733 RepID=UPI002F261FB9